MKIVRIIIAVLLFSIQLQATTLTENFDNGINSNLWQVSKTDAAGAPWSVDTLNSSKQLIIYKPSDNDSATAKQYLAGGLKSIFLIDGDFSVSVNFDLLNLPYSTPSGWNEANLMVKNEVTGVDFQVLRFTTKDKHYVEGYSPVNPYAVGQMIDSTMTGSFKISRVGQTMSAWIDRGEGFVLLGARTSSEYLGAMTVNLLGSQVTPDDGVKYRPNTSLSINYDNVMVTADMIIPEPATILLLGLGGLLLRRSR